MLIARGLFEGGLGCDGQHIFVAQKRVEALNSHLAEKLGVRSDGNWQGPTS